tara:strand:+ start:1220 stop:1405 length:186 start_codon:yes stop_codon:yes gene_type:complete
VNLRRVDQQLAWPDAVPPHELREWVRSQLLLEGDLLRWAITAVSRDSSGARWLQVEAVVQK